MRILIVDDHPVMRGGIRASLRNLDATLDFVEAADLPEAVQAAKAHHPIDLVLFDLMLPGVSSIEALRAFRESVEPCPPVVVFSATDDADIVREALDAGAMGFIPKTSTPAILEHALRLVLANGIYVPPTVLRRQGAETPGRGAPQRLRQLSELGLTPRQQQVCALMVKGHPVKQIARQLDISTATVKAHLQPILRSLGAMNRTEAIVALHRLEFSLPD
ncbi:MAG TPA: response regulator transcription factor [Burkholderiales bacterium]|nr:response regulator transcription factor [Burkholderiales bacterium]